MMHYYFKFQAGNVGFRKFLNLKEGDNVPLSIYYWKWKYEEKATVGVPNQKDFRSKKQINQFFSVKDNLTNVFFWLFYNDQVLYFKPLSGIVYDGPNSLIDNKWFFS